MGKTLDFLSGTKILEEIESPINGKLTVVRDLAWGTYIKGGGLTQSGGVARKVWKTSLRKVQRTGYKVKNCLILGLGGGSIVKLVKKFWPEVKITGVDIDPVIVELGKKYLGLDENQVEIIIDDAYTFCTVHCPPSTIHYDLVCVDLYVGDDYPSKFETERFMSSIKNLLADNGVAVFNRLYYDEKKDLADKFEKKLESIFSKVQRVRPEANVMFVCSG